MKKLTLIFMPLLVLISLYLYGCSEDRSAALDPKNPVTITLWHNYGGVMQNTMDTLIDEFNNTLGREKGVIVTVTSINSSSGLNEKLQMIIDDEPGAPEAPNITICQPKIAIKLAEKSLLCDLKDYFSKEELEAYVEDFLKEGYIDDSLYVFPTAKSTEVLFVNETLFNRFSEATGVKLQELSTFEGLCEASIKYSHWCDKAFYTADSYFNVFSVLGQQLEEPFIVNEELQIASDSYKHLHEIFSEAVAKGGIAIYDGYSSDLSKTGDIVCSTGSTAGILFYGDSITYPDNTTEAVEYTVLPYPTLQTGKKVALQRGNGMSVLKGEKQEEYASALFLKWFTAKEQNLKFISETGYLPVTKAAYESIVNGQIPQTENNNIKKLLAVAVEMQKDYSFYIPPVYEEYDAQSKSFEAGFKEEMSALTSRDN